MKLRDSPPSDWRRARRLPTTGLPPDQTKTSCPSGTSLPTSIQTHSPGRVSDDVLSPRVVPGIFLSFLVVECLETPFGAERFGKRALPAAWRSFMQSRRKGKTMPVWIDAAFYLAVLGLLSGIYGKLSQAVDRLTK